MNAMLSGYTRMISALWEHLGLGEPGLDEQGAVFLPLEPRRVEFSPSADGRHVIASLYIAPLSDEPTRQHAQFNALLRLSLLALTANRGAICFEDIGDLTFVVVRGMCPCEIGLIHRLSDIVADIVYLGNECQSVLDAQGPRSRSDGPAMNAAEDEIIFSP